MRDSASTDSSLSRSRRNAARSYERWSRCEASDITCRHSLVSESSFHCRPFVQRIRAGQTGRIRPSQDVMLLGFEEVRRQWHATLHEHDWQLSRVFALDALLNPIDDDHNTRAISLVASPLVASFHGILELELHLPDLVNLAVRIRSNQIRHREHQTRIRARAVRASL